MTDYKGRILQFPSFPGADPELDPAYSQILFYGTVERLGNTYPIGQWVDGVFVEGKWLVDLQHSYNIGDDATYPVTVTYGLPGIIDPSLTYKIRLGRAGDPVRITTGITASVIVAPLEVGWQATIYSAVTNE